MRDADNIRAVEGLAVDLMGFIFWPKSSRYVSEPPAYLPTKCKRVGVFVDAAIDDILHHIVDYHLDFVQLHGHESPDFLHHLRTACSDNISFIKAFNIATKDDFEATKLYEGIAEYFLFDTKGKSVGGNGEKFDWSVLTYYNGKTPFFLSGGIGPDDADRLKTLSADSGFPADRCIGIDLNSRFESAPGMKDIVKLKTFLSYE
jgi:phosphoribosylanthranilate isomerase